MRRRGAFPIKGQKKSQPHHNAQSSNFIAERAKHLLGVVWVDGDLYECGIAMFRPVRLPAGVVADLADDLQALMHGGRELLRLHFDSNMTWTRYVDCYKDEISCGLAIIDADDLMRLLQIFCKLNRSTALKTS